MSAIITKIYSFLLTAVLLFSAISWYQGRLESKHQADIVPKKIPIEEVVKKMIPGTTRDASFTTITSTTTTLSATTVPKYSTTTNGAHQEEIDVPLQRNFSSIPASQVCKTTIKYKLGRFDDGFDISKSYLLESAASAVTLWNSALGRDVFVYDEQGPLTINLIYDGRQASTQENQLLAAEIKNTQDAASALKSEYEAMEQTFVTEKDDYVSKVNTFNTDQKAYNDTVNNWNAKGGAPPSDYDALMKEKERLQSVSIALTSEQNVLTNMLQEINKRIARYNELVLFANDNIALGNKLARKKFTEGQYIPQTNEIDIYQFTDDIKLERVLAHEFGHALGLDHNKNKDSIMYAINSATTTVLSKEDVDSLKALCSQQ